MRTFRYVAVLAVIALLCVAATFGEPARVMALYVGYGVASYAVVLAVVFGMRRRTRSLDVLSGLPFPVTHEPPQAAYPDAFGRELVRMRVRLLDGETVDVTELPPGDPLAQVARILRAWAPEQPIRDVTVMWTCHAGPPPTI